MIQPEFIMPSLQHRNDPEGLFRRFLSCCPKVTFRGCKDIEELSDDKCFILHKAWTAIMSDDATGSEKCVCTLTEEALDLCASFFNVKSNECTMLEKENKPCEIANSSKIRDQVLRVAVALQLIELSLEFLNNNPNFFESDAHMQPLLPNATKTQDKYLSCAIILVEACNQQRDAFACEEINDKPAISAFDANVDMGVFLFRGLSHNGTR